MTVLSGIFVSGASIAYRYLAANPTAGTPEHNQSYRANTIDKHSWSPIVFFHDTSHGGLEHFLFSAAGRIPNSVGGSGRHRRAELRYGFADQLGVLVVGYDSQS